MIDLTNYSKIKDNQEKSHIRSVLVCIHGIDINDLNNSKFEASTAINDETVTIPCENFDVDYKGYAVIENEIIEVLGVNTITKTITVNRGCLGTKATAHPLITGKKYDIISVQIFKNIENYSYSHKTDVSDNDLFGVSMDGGTITLLDEPYKWNIYANDNLYKYRNMKEVFIFEGCNGELIKVYDGITSGKTTNSRQGRITIAFKNVLYKWFNEEIRQALYFENTTIKELLETIFENYTVIFPEGYNTTEFLNISNFYFKQYKYYSELLQALSRNHCCRIRFTTNKRIYVFNDLFQEKLTISTQNNIEGKLIDINDDSNNLLVINAVIGTYKEIIPLYDISQFSDGTCFVWTRQISQTGNKTIIQNGEFKELNLICTEEDLKYLTYNDYLLVKSGTSEYWCKIYDFEANGATSIVSVVSGIDKPSYFNYFGRLQKLDGTAGLEHNIILSNPTAYVGKTELPIVTKYARNINGKDYDSTIKFPIIAGETYTFYLNFSYPDNDNFKFSGMIKDIDNIFDVWLTNTDLLYNKESQQNKSVFLYSNKIDSFGNITTIDNSNIEIRLTRSTIEKTDIKVEIKNTLPNPTNPLLIQPVEVLSNGWVIKVVPTGNSFDIGDVLMLDSFVYFNEGTVSTSELSNKQLDITGASFPDVNGMYIIINNVAYLIKVRIDANTIELWETAPICENAFFEIKTYVYTYINENSGTITIANNHNGTSTVRGIGTAFKPNHIDCVLSCEGHSYKITQYLGNTTLLIDGEINILTDSNYVINQPLYNQYIAFKETRYTIKNTEISSYGGGTNNALLLYLDSPYPQPIDYFDVSDMILKTTRYKYSDVILLNEFFIRGNPLMIREQNIEILNAESIELYGKKEYKLESTFTNRSELEKVLNYLKNTFSGLDDTNTRLKINFELLKRLDLEVGDTISLSDSVYTKFKDKKCCIISKDVSENGNGGRTERYEALTIGNYTLSTQSILKYNDISFFKATTSPQYSHRGNEATQDNDLNSNIGQATASMYDNRQITLIDENEGIIIAETTSFTAKTDIDVFFQPNDTNFEIRLTDITENSVYLNMFLKQNTEGLIKINNEYLTYYVFKDTFTNLFVKKRGIGKTETDYIKDNYLVTFYKINSKVGKIGLKSNAVNLGDNTSTFINLDRANDEAEIKIGIDGSTVDYFIGTYPLNYMYLNDKGLGIRSSYFNNTVYVRNSKQFISALDYTKATDGFGNENYYKYLYDNGASINKIVMLNSFDCTRHIDFLTEEDYYSTATFSGANYLVLLSSNVSKSVIALGLDTATDDGVVVCPTALTAPAHSLDVLIDIDGNIINMVELVRADNGQKIFVEDKEVFGLVQAYQGIVDGETINLLEDKIQLSFVMYSGDELVLADVSAYNINFKIKYKYTNKISVNASHFGTDNRLIPHTDIKEICGTNRDIKLGATGFELYLNSSRKLNIYSLWLNDFGRSSTGYAIYAYDLNLTDINFDNLNGQIETEMYSNFKNIGVWDYKDDVQYMFNYVDNIDNIFINMYDNMIATNAFVFHECRNIKNIRIENCNTANYIEAKLFNKCGFIENLYIDNLSYTQIFYDCTQISNCYFGIAGSLSTSGNTTYLIENCSHISNIKCDNCSNYNKYIKDSSYLINNNICTITEVTGLTKDVNNSWN